MNTSTTWILGLAILLFMSIIPQAQAAVCVIDQDCNNGLFCDGRERCAPGSTGADERGCVKGRAPCDPLNQVCNEEVNDCRDACPDRDGDGHADHACGGDDCDDNDSARYPGNLEVCDFAGHDEDCNETTFGVLDLDRDGQTDARCWNKPF